MIFFAFFNIKSHLWVLLDSKQNIQKFELVNRVYFLNTDADTSQYTPKDRHVIATHSSINTVDAAVVVTKLIETN